MKVRYSIYLFISFIFLLESCSNEPELNCGCNAETTDTILDNDRLEGELFYRTSTQEDDTYYVNNFWIIHRSSSCGNCILNLIVCNEEILTNAMLELKDTDDLLRVQFAGEVKDVCEKTFGTATTRYSRILLTSINVNQN